MVEIGLKYCISENEINVSKLWYNAEEEISKHIPKHCNCPLYNDLITLDSRLVVSAFEPDWGYNYVDLNKDLSSGICTCAWNCTQTYLLSGLWKINFQFKKLE